MQENPITIIAKKHNVSLSTVKFTEDLEGYKIDPFTALNRNHFDDRPGGSSTIVQSLVMHYTVGNFDSVLGLFTQDIPDNRVSAHYIVTQPEGNIKGGEVVQVAPDEKRSWHAGVSKWREIVNLNGTSIGIENVNKGFTDHPGGKREWYPFDNDQIQALGKLSKSIVATHNINPVYVVGHCDIAPNRKQDPGILFPWGVLHERYGVGAWLMPDERSPEALQTKYILKEPIPQGVSIPFLSTCLSNYGYNIEPVGQLDQNMQNVLLAFKSHFSGNGDVSKYTTTPDANDMVWAAGLNAKYSTQGPARV